MINQYLFRQFRDFSNDVAATFIGPYSMSFLEIQLISLLKNFKIFSTNKLF